MVSRLTRDLAGYTVRRGNDGKMGVYVRNYNVRVLTFATNSSALQNALTQVFNTAHKKVEKENAKCP